MSITHREIGKDLHFFFFDDISPGSCFFLPMGAQVYLKLMSYLRHCYKKLGYSEVMTPNLYNKNISTICI